MRDRVLLDTNIVIALFAGDKDVIQQLVEAGEVFIPVIVLGELYFGARNSAREEENVARLDALAESNAILRCDDVTAKLYGQIKKQLKESGSLYLKMTSGFLRLLCSLSLRWLLATVTLSQLKA